MEEKNFYQKLNAIQVALKAPKGQYNSFGKYKYRSCEDILDALKPHLAETGLILSVSDDLVMIGERYYIKATATITDGISSKSVNGYAREEENKKGMDGSQVTGASSSYARKYALNGLFCIDDNKDSDYTNVGNNTKEESKAKPIEEAKTVSQTDLAKRVQTDVMVISDIDDLREYWKNHSEYHTNEELLKIFVARSKELKDAK